MPDARRFARAALLLLGSAVLAAVVATLATPRFAGARIPAAANLPWPATVLVADRRPPFMLLYVDSHCEHCSRAAVLVDSVSVARALQAVIVTSDAPADAALYQQKLGLHRPLQLDSSRALIRALGTRSVPTLVLFHSDGSRQLVVGYTRDARYRRTLAEFAR